MKKLFSYALLLLLLCSCEKNIKVTSPEIEIFNTVKNTINQSSAKKKSVNVRDVITREMIYAASIPLLFVEKSDGKNGTMTTYPGANLEETWYGKDGTTLSLLNGEFLATRGFGDDIMNTVLPRSLSFNERTTSPYDKIISFLTSENKINNVFLSCVMTSDTKHSDIKIFSLNHTVLKYTEKCNNNTSNNNIENIFWQNLSGNTIKSKQWHSDTLGYIIIMRLY
jgi:hypothetical protein